MCRGLYQTDILIQIPCIALSASAFLHTMVNTFLVCSNYKHNMTLIDWRRLGKQRLEAKQIHEYVVNIRTMWQWYCEHPPTNTEGKVEDWSVLYPYVPVLSNEASLSFSEQASRFVARCKWTSSVVNRYFSLDTQLILVSGDEIQQRPIKYRCNKEEGERPLLFLRHARHPSVAMWMGYEDSLKLYFNACVKEWIARGYKNTMVLFDIENEAAVLHPWWVYSDALHNSHKSALLRKEFVRIKEKRWYWDKPFFTAIRSTPYYAHGYIWPSSLPTSIVKIMMKNKSASIASLACAPVKNDFVEESEQPYFTDSEGYAIIRSFRD